MPSLKLVVFDLGGTTIRDRGEVVEAFTSALRHAGIACSPAELQQWRGASKRDVLKALVSRQGGSSAIADRIYDDFSGLLKARLSATSGLALAGSGAAFAALKGAGLQLALNSGFDREVIDLVLASVDWPDGTFDAVVCAEDVRRGRPAPYMIFRAMERTGVDDVHQVATVGDTRLDLEAGWRGGVACRIGVLSGAHDRTTLELAPFTHIVDDITAVPGICLGQG